MKKRTSRTPTCHPEREHQAHGLCKSCYAQRPEQKAKSQRRGRERYQANRQQALDAMKKERLMRRYQMTVEEYDALYAKQEGRCAICHEQKRLVIDHDHATGVRRELLCDRCNSRLSILESPFHLERSVHYLLKHGVHIPLLGPLEANSRKVVRPPLVLPPGLQEEGIAA